MNKTVLFLIFMLSNFVFSSEKADGTEAPRDLVTFERDDIVKFQGFTDEEAILNGKLARYMRFSVDSQKHLLALDPKIPGRRSLVRVPKTIEENMSLVSKAPKQKRIEDMTPEEQAQLAQKILFSSVNFAIGMTGPRSQDSVHLWTACQEMPHVAEASSIDFNERPLTQDELAHISELSEASFFGGEAFVCSICQTGVKEGDLIRSFACNASSSHQFHKDCIEKWLLTKRSSCPLCRRNIRPPHLRANIPSISGEIFGKNL